MPDMARFDPFSPTMDHPMLNSSPDYGSRNSSFRTRAIGSDIGIITPQMSFRDRDKRLRTLEKEKNDLMEVLKSTRLLHNVWALMPEKGTAVSTRIHATPAGLVKT
jgi:hypothetical protein